MNPTHYPTPAEVFKTDPPSAREYDDNERIGCNGDVYDPNTEEQ